MFKNLFRKIRGKPIDGSNIPVERGEFANPSDANPRSRQGSGVESDSLASLESEDEDEPNRQYKQGLKANIDAVRQRIEENKCPREEIKNFEIIGKLASGGFGEVWKVKYSRDQKFYALKVQPKLFIRSKYAIEYSIREKKFMSALDFEFIVKLHFAFKDARNLYLVNDYAYFGDVMQLLQFRLPEMSIKLIIAQCVLGIEYLHACSIAHRDIKPDNLFIFEDGYIKIGDFGLAKQFRGCTDTCVGTPLYMAPEALDQKKYRKGVDWWAMGILLYRLVYYRHPFAELHYNRHQVLDCINHVDLSFPEVVFPGSPINDFISALLEKVPAKRLGLIKDGSSNIKNHEWFSNISFSDVLNKRIVLPPWEKEVECTPHKILLFLPHEGEEDYMPDLFKDF